MMFLFKRLFLLFVLFFYTTFLVLPISYAQESVGKATKRLYIPVSGNVTFVNGSSETKLLVNNYLSSNILEINPEGKMNSHMYYPDGNILDSRLRGNDERGADKLFTNHRKLENLNIYHAGARFYSPTTGTFIQPDQKEGPNRYAYVGNNPIAFIDKLGTNRESAIVERIIEWVGGKMGNLFSKEVSQEVVRNTGFVKIVSKDLPSGSTIDLGNYGRPPILGDSIHLVQDGEWHYNSELPPEKDDHTRLFRGVQSRAVGTEFLPPPTQEQIAIWEGLMKSGGWPSRAEFETYGEPVMRGGSDRFYTPSLEMAQRDIYAGQSIVYYADLPNDKLGAYQVDVDLMEEVYKIPHATIVRSKCGVYCVGGKMIK